MNTLYRHRILYFSVFMLYLFLRIIVWQNTSVVEDADSIRYLEETRIFRELNPSEINKLTPDSTPFYPFFSALFSLPGWSAEFAARLCSLVFSAGLFVALIGIGRRFAPFPPILFSLLILSFNSVLMRMSIGVLTEPAYIAVIYIGFWLFCTQYSTLNYKKAFFLGIIFGLSFLNRVEGILFIAVIPGLQLVYHFYFDQSKETKSRIVTWIFVYVLGFGLMAVPQVLHVSTKMGSLAINGRQAWSIMLNNADGKSYEEKKHGLDFSPGEINLEYLLTHPEAREKLSGGDFLTKIKELAMKIAYHYTQFYQLQLGVFIGPFGLILFGFGLLSVLKSGKYFELFIVVGFLGTTLVAPILWSVDLRTIIIIGPMVILMEGLGIVFVSNAILEPIQNTYRLRLKKVLPVFITSVLLLSTAVPVFLILNPPSTEIRKKVSVLLGNPYNSTYRPKELDEVLAAILENSATKDGNFKIVSRKGYLAYQAKAERVRMPYTDYKGLIRYCNLNQINYLFLDYRQIKEYPFLARFEQGDIPDFKLLYSKTKKDKKRMIELYQFESS